MAYTAIAINLIRSGKENLYTLFDRVRSNFEDHQSRITTLEGTLANFPTGVIAPYVNGVGAPAGWLYCDGSVVSQTTYADLYAVVGSTFNSGSEGAGNFRLPDMRGKAPVGAGTGSGLTARTLGQEIGTESETLNTTQIASHSHGVTDPGHNHEFPTMKENDAGSFTVEWANDPNLFVNGGNNDSTWATNSATTGINTNNNGGGGSHNNMQPSTVCAFIIKT